MDTQIQKRLLKIVKAHKSENSQKLDAELAFLTDMTETKSENEKTEVSEALLSYLKKDLPIFESMVIVHKIYL